MKRASLPESKAVGILRLTSVARDLGVHPSTLRRWCESGEGPPHIRTPRGTYLFNADDVKNWKRTLERRPDKETIQNEQRCAP
jgi:excisionase family DNA binding protein